MAGEGIPMEPYPGPAVPCWIPTGPVRYDR
jgi:hypothetical protein